jgi:hypothetical protein
MKTITKLMMVLFFLTSCAGGKFPSGSSTPVTIPPNTFSDASIDGNYNFEDTADFSGVLTADGKGKITAGLYSDVNTSDPTNHQIADFSITGNYTINPDGTGTMQLLLTCESPQSIYPQSPDISRCPVYTTLNVISSITIVANGSFTFSMLPYQNGTAFLTYTATKN